MRSGLGGVAEFHGLGLHLEIDLGIDVRGVEAGVAEPGADRIEIDAGLQEVTGACVTDRVRCDFPLGERRHAGCGTLDEPFVVAEDGTRLLKTIIPSRKAMRDYRRRQSP